MDLVFFRANFFLHDVIEMVQFHEFNITVKRENKLVDKNV